MPLPLLLLLPPSVLAAEPANRVFLLVIDGARSMDMVDSEFAYCPMLDRTYLPEGSLVPILDNRDSTYTDAAHRTITTGHRQPTSGIAWDDDHDLCGGISPTIFERFARENGLPGTAGYVTGNSVFMDNQGNGIYPGFQGYSAFEYADHEIQDLDDYGVLEDLEGYLDNTDGVRLVLWNIHQADKLGHRGLEDEYRDALSDADGAIDRLVRERGEPGDAYFVFADHGRHDGLTNWANHGDECAGCRESFLLAWGQGIRSGGNVIAEPYELQDMAVTAAWAAGLQMPEARGRPIVEMLEDPPDRPADDDQMVDPVVLADASGTVHMLTQLLPWGADPGKLLYRQGTGDPIAWGAWEEIPQTVGTMTPESARLVTDGGRVYALWRAYDPGTRFWGTVESHSDDGGGSWSAAASIDPGVFHFLSPDLAVDPIDGTLHGVWWSSNTPHTDEPAAFTWVSNDGSGWDQQETATTEEIHLPLECHTAIVRGEPLAACSGILDVDYPHEDEEKGAGDTQNREIVIVKDFTTGATPELVQVTDNPNVSFWPSIAVDGDDVIHLAWAERTPPLDEGGWSVWYATSDDAGETWSTPLQVDPGGPEAWRPNLLLTSAGPVVAYTEVDGPQHRAMLAFIGGGQITGYTALSEEEYVIDGLWLTELPGRNKLLATWNDGRSTLEHSVQTAEAALDGGSDWEPGEGDTDTDTDADTDTDTDTDTAVDSGGDSGADSDTGATGSRSCCGVTDPRGGVAMAMAVSALALTRRRRA